MVVELVEVEVDELVEVLVEVVDEELLVDVLVVEDEEEVLLVVVDHVTSLFIHPNSAIFNVRILLP